MWVGERKGVLNTGLKNREAGDAAARAAAEAQQKAQLEAQQKSEAEAKAKAEQSAKDAAEAAKRTKQMANAVTGNAPSQKSAATEYSERLDDMAAKGLLCPAQTCRSRRTRVTRTVQREGGIVVRYRECQACGHTFSTEEKPRS